MKSAIMTALLAMAFTHGVSQAQGEPPVYAVDKCGPHDAMVDVLTGYKYQETRRGWGLYGKDAAYLVELYVQDDGDNSSWTVLMTDPAGEACIVGFGLDWHWLTEGSIELREEPVGEAS